LVGIVLGLFVLSIKIDDDENYFHFSFFFSGEFSSDKLADWFIEEL